MEAFQNRNWVNSLKKRARALQEKQNRNALRKIQGNRFIMNPQPLSFPKLTPDTFQPLNPNNKPVMRQTNGLVLVFDLDGTIAKFPSGIHSDLEISMLDINRVQVNPTIMKIFQAAIDARERGKVDAILMLTNNSSSEYINKLLIRLNKVISQELSRQLHEEISVTIFDKVFYAGYDEDDLFIPVNKRHNYPGKYIQDVKYMLNELHINNNNLHDNVYFFDDLKQDISKQIINKHYILIFPEFGTFDIDHTDYSGILNELSLKGGRQKRTTRKGRRRQAMRRRRTAKK